MREDKIDKLVGALLSFRHYNNLNTEYTPEEFTYALLIVINKLSRP